MLLRYICFAAEKVGYRIHSIYFTPINSTLQAQANCTCLHPRRRASSSAPLFNYVLRDNQKRNPNSAQGSATVEAALTLPIFLCAICFLAMLGQLLLVEGEVQHALSRTAAYLAARESADLIKMNDSQSQKDSLSERTGTGSASMAARLETAGVFYSCLQGKDLCSACITGGTHGILVKAAPSEEGYISVAAVYSLKIPLPLLRTSGITRRLQTRRRLYTGFLPDQGDQAGKNRLVYLAEHGQVYHTSLSCSHISLRINGSLLAAKMLEARGIRPCEKCIRSGSPPDAFYITAEGDCYHSTLSCSGLKRTVKTVRLSEVKGMRLCARCAAGNGR